MMTTYESQDQPWHGPGLSPVERQMASYLGVEVVNTRRRSERVFDVEIDYIAPGEEGSTGWMPLVLLHLEWKQRPVEVGELAEDAGCKSAADCAQDFVHVRDLDDMDKFMSMCHAIWALACARRNG